MLEILKKHGIPAAGASLIVLAITIVPIIYQYKYTVQQNARIAALEQKIAALEKK
jgi:hypothetical protein